jgi:hypothetical protein
MPQSHLWVRADPGFEIPFAIDLPASLCAVLRLRSAPKRLPEVLQETIRAHMQGIQERFVVALWGDDSLPNRPVGRGHFRYRS